MDRFLLPLIAGAALAGTAGAASAIPFTITGGDATPTGISVGSTVDVHVPDGLARKFYLDVGETTRFDFIDVSVSGLGLAIGHIDAEWIAWRDPSNDRGRAGWFLRDSRLGLGRSAHCAARSGHGSHSATAACFDVDFFVSLLRAPGTTSVPEPATLTLLGAGLVAIGLKRRRRAA